MKRLLALTLLTTAISVPAMAETSLNTGSSTGVGLSVNTGVADTSVGADVDTGASVSGSSSSDMNSSSSPAAEEDSSASSSTTPDESTTAETETSATGQAIAGNNLARNDVVMIQQALRQEGFYNGTADGVWGPRTASALMQFQQQNKLGATGHLNTNTLDKLGVELGAAASSSTSADVNSNNESTIDSSEGVGSSGNPGSANTY